VAESNSYVFICTYTFQIAFCYVYVKCFAVTLVSVSCETFSPLVAAVHGQSYSIDVNNIHTYIHTMEL
jgi:hypothetical protein